MSVYQGPRPTPTNYSKFDRIVDSDDEDDVTTRPGGPPASLDHFAKAMPPHLYRKLTEAQMAAASGDHAAALRAQQELNDELERGPQEFRDAMAQAQRLRGSGGRTSAKDTSGLTAHEVRAQLQEQSAKLAQLEQVEHMQDNPEEMARLLMGSGLTPEMLAEAEASEDPEAMRRLAERMVAATMGGEVGMGALGRESTPADARAAGQAVAAALAGSGGGAKGGGGHGGGQGGADTGTAAGGVANAGGQANVGGGASRTRQAEESLERMRLELEEGKARMASAQREVDAQLEAAKAALEGRDRAQAEFDEANQRKLAQGAVVDSSGAELKRAVAAEEHARREAELQLQGAVDE